MWNGEKMRRPWLQVQKAVLNWPFEDLHQKHDQLKQESTDIFIETYFGNKFLFSLFKLSLQTDDWLLELISTGLNCLVLNSANKELDIKISSFVAILIRFQTKSKIKIHEIIHMQSVTSFQIMINIKI